MMHIRPCLPGDEAPICAIYNHYIATSIATFEEVALDPGQMRERIDRYQQHFPWLVCEYQGDIAGYCYAAPFHQRTAFRHTVEATVYVREGLARSGIGRALYQALLPALTEQGFQTVIAAISMPNAGSVRLHEALGFRKAGHLERVGYKFDQWIDVGYWQKMLQDTDPQR